MNKKIKINKIFLFFLILIFFIFIIFCILYIKRNRSFYINKKDKRQIDFLNKNQLNVEKDIEIQELKPKKSELELAKKLAYLSLKQFEEGLSNSRYQEDYKNIIIGDPEKFKENVLNGTLSTVSTSLIKGSIDFLSKILNREINLIINDNFVLSSCLINPLDHKQSKNTIDLKLRNKNDSHFFIEEPNDTPGDGYCFFHALIFSLDKTVMNWRNIIDKYLN
ncbi:MAG: putative effector [Candidatus Phytoplasma cynodontis]|nr:MAG: putative effector [Candidatus Phytoplasma cynodontis]